MTNPRHSDDTWRPTRWTLVQDTVEGTDPERAWRELIDAYRRPIERSIRRRLRRIIGSAHGDEDAIVGEFFGWIYERGALARADRRQGRFRCYMQGVIRNYVFHALRARRGLPDGLEPMEPSPASDADAIAAEERDWADGLLEQALRQLAEQNPRDAQFLTEAYGLGETPTIDRSLLAERESMERNAVDQALHKARTRLRHKLEQSIRDSVTNPSDRDGELETVIARLLDAHPRLDLAISRED